MGRDVKELEERVEALEGLLRRAREWIRAKVELADREAMDMLAEISAELGD